MQAVLPIITTVRFRFAGSRAENSSSQRQIGQDNCSPQAIVLYEYLFLSHFLKYSRPQRAWTLGEFPKTDSDVLMFRLIPPPGMFFIDTNLRGSVLLLGEILSLYRTGFCLMDHIKRINNHAATD